MTFLILPSDLVSIHEEQKKLTIHSPTTSPSCELESELIAAFVQDKSSVERGLLEKDLIPEELTQIRYGKIVKEKYPDLEEEDQEGVRQRVVAAMNLTQKAKEIAVNNSDKDSENSDRLSNNALLEGIRKFSTDVSELNIDLIDRINPFGTAYSILSKTMSEESLRQIHSIISSKKIKINIEEARDLAKRAIIFKRERGRLPLINSPDPWERRMAEGISVLQKKESEKNND